jgi:hypothetical protein
MKHNTMLTVASLPSLLLLTLHITDDIVRGISKAESSNTALLVLAVFLYGTLVLPERRSGHLIILLIGLIAAAMPVIHMRGATLQRNRPIPRRLFLRLDTLGARRARGLHYDPLGARAVGSATEAAPVVQGNGRWTILAHWVLQQVTA